MSAVVKRTDLVHKTEVRRLIDRAWSPFLKSSEKRVIDCIFTMTIEWGKAFDRFKRKHIAEKTGLCLKTIWTTITRLLNRGALLGHREVYGYRLGLNIDWDPAKDDMLKQPKAQRQERPSGLAVPKQNGKIYHSGMVNFTTPIERNTSLQEQSLDNSPTLTRRTAVQVQKKETVSTRETEKVLPTIESAIAIGRTRHRAIVDQKAAQGFVKAIWSKAYAETFPDNAMPVWGEHSKQVGQAKLFIKGSNIPDKADLLAWVVTEWRLIISTRFATWMKTNIPEFPDIGFALAFKEKFYDAWNDRNRLAGELNLTGHDRMRRRMVHKGYSPEQAQAEIDQRASVQGREAELKRERERLNKAFRKLDEMNGMALKQSASVGTSRRPPVELVQAVDNPIIELEDLPPYVDVD